MDRRLDGSKWALWGVFGEMWATAFFPPNSLKCDRVSRKFWWMSLGWGREIGDKRYWVSTWTAALAMKCGMRWKTINFSPVHTCSELSLRSTFPAMLFMFSLWKSLFLSRAHYHNDKEIFIAAWGSMSSKNSHSSAAHAPFRARLSPLRKGKVQDRMEKRQQRSIFRNWFNY